MKLLAIETSSSACSVALDLEGELFEDHIVEPRAHTRILMPMITRILERADVALPELDAIVLGNGPGSFIGMRIGASVAQGLCHGAGLGIVPVSSLAAVAAEAFSASDAERVVVTQDARMQEVYVGIFRRGETGLPVAEREEVISAAGDLQLDGGPYAAAGDGWNRYPEMLASGACTGMEQLPVSHPKARFLLAIAASTPADLVSPASLVPSYLRHKVAEKPPKTA
ncbi:MAG: tRNA (adenosine(37)-N6)-threonylcarbamoyltransferase complex dimerization subunit type 1 TsaB [Woeseiaceae bacterium]